MTGEVLIGVGLVAVVYWIVVTIMIYENLKNRGIPVSFLWLRLYAPKYAHQYKKLTEAETGRAGPLFYHWLVSINTALVAVVIGALVW
jgi:hypothetical protein